MAMQNTNFGEILSPIVRTRPERKFAPAARRTLTAKEQSRNHILRLLRQRITTQNATKGFPRTAPIPRCD